MNRRVQGEVALITGAAGGIASAIARRLVRDGIHVALLDNRQEALQTLAEELRANYPDRLVSCAVADLRTQSGVQEGIAEALTLFDFQIDLLVAAVGVLVQGRIEELSIEQWHAVFEINLFSQVLTIQTVLPQMKERRQGSILVVGSDQGLQPDEGLSAYAATKAALHSLTKSLSRELARFGIRVNAVAPGMTRTPLVEQLMARYATEFVTDVKTAEHLELQRRGVPMLRLLEPEEVAEAVAYLAHATGCTGTILNVSAGSVRSSAT